VIFAVYRRLRRSFGRQLLRPRRMIVRIVLIAAVACALLPLGLRSTQFLWAELAGGALGIGLGVWGAQRTRFVMHDGRLHYVPHTYTGIAVSLLFLGRLAFRAVQASTDGPPLHGASAAQGGDTMAASHGFALPAVSTPLTVGIFFVLAGYYLCYYSRVLWKSKHPSTAVIEPSSPPPLSE